MVGRTKGRTVGQTIDFLRSSEFSDTEFYLIFVVDPARNPIGEVGLGRLLCTPRPRRISEIMEGDFRKIPADMDQEEVSILFRRYGMVSAPVVDEHGRLIGMITIDDIIDDGSDEDSQPEEALAVYESEDDPAVHGRGRGGRRGRGRGRGGRRGGGRAGGDDGGGAAEDEAGDVGGPHVVPDPSIVKS